MHNQTLQSVSFAMYFDVDLSTNLHYNRNINIITSNASKSVEFNRRNVKTKHKDVREGAYKTCAPTIRWNSSPLYGVAVYTNLHSALQKHAYSNILKILP